MKPRFYTKKILCLGFTFSLILFIFSTFNIQGNEKPKKIDKIVVHKSKRVMKVYSKSKIWKSYKIALGDSPIGHKREQGDEKTPEGKYKIDFKNPNSCCHLSLKISYPNAKDKAQAQKRGVSPGGDIFIHGFPNWVPNDFSKTHTLFDWTDGCVGVTNEEMDEIYPLVSVGTEIEILP